MAPGHVPAPVLVPTLRTQPDPAGDDGGNGDGGGNGGIFVGIAIGVAAASGMAGLALVGRKFIIDRRSRAKSGVRYEAVELSNAAAIPRAPESPGSSLSRQESAQEFAESDSGVML